MPCHEVGLSSSQILVGYSHTLYATIVLVYLSGRSPLQIEGFVAGLVFIFLLSEKGQSSHYCRCFRAWPSWLYHLPGFNFTFIPPRPSFNDVFAFSNLPTSLQTRVTRCLNFSAFRLFSTFAQTAPSREAYPSHQGCYCPLPSIPYPLPCFLFFTL